MRPIRESCTSKQSSQRALSAPSHGSQLSSPKAGTPQRPECCTGTLTHTLKVCLTGQLYSSGLSLKLLSSHTLSMSAFSTPYSHRCLDVNPDSAHCFCSLGKSTQWLSHTGLSTVSRKQQEQRLVRSEHARNPGDDLAVVLKSRTLKNRFLSFYVLVTMVTGQETRSSLV